MEDWVLAGYCIARRLSPAIVLERVYALALSLQGDAVFLPLRVPQLNSLNLTGIPCN